MSPALDMPLSRREAFTSVLAMLAFVLGAGVVSEDAEAAELSMDAAENAGAVLRAGDRRYGEYDFDGVIVGHDGDFETNAVIRIRDATIAIQHAGSNKVRTILAQKPAAIAFVDTLAAELRGTSINEPVDTPPRMPTQRPNGVFLGFVDCQEWNGRFKGYIDVGALERFEPLGV